MDNTNSIPIRILIADDHQMFIDGLKTMLRRVNSVSVVAEALNGIEALDIIKKQDIDLLVTDISMPGMSGIELTKLVKKQFPTIKILVVTMYNDREIIREALLSEAEGYILKNTGKQELLFAINTIIDNGTHYSNEVLSIFKDTFVKTKTIEQNIKVLTEREKEIVELICLELPTRKIADELCISAGTVESHRKNIYKKLNVNTVVALVKFAIINEIIKI